MKQSEKFIELANKLRHFLQMKRICSTSQIYRKMLGLEVNKEKNRELTGFEKQSLSIALNEVIKNLIEFKKELK
jgi:hypothetical protein